MTDRLFWSVADTWKSVMSLPTDVKELIPEFYAADPSFLLNTGNVDFGSRTAGTGLLVMSMLLPIFKLIELVILVKNDNVNFSMLQTPP